MLFIEMRDLNSRRLFNGLAKSNDLFPKNLEAGFWDYKQQYSSNSGRKQINIRHGLVSCQASPEFVFHYHSEPFLIVVALHVRNAPSRSTALCFEVQVSRTVEPNLMNEFCERTRCGGRSPEDKA
jgi:hypothetical protein